jgi:hypothetical protein
MGTPLTHTARPWVLELIAPLTASRSAPAVSLVSGPAVGRALSAYRCRRSAGEKKILPMRIFAAGALLLDSALLLAGAFGRGASSSGGAAPLIAGTSAISSARESPRSSG